MKPLVLGENDLKDKPMDGLLLGTEIQTNSVIDEIPEEGSVLIEDSLAYNPIGVPKSDRQKC